MVKLLPIVILFLPMPLIHAQRDYQNGQNIQNIVEDFLESTDGENFDYNTIFENLHFYFDHPLNINEATEADLKELYLLNEIQIHDFITHRAKYGAFLSIYELQALPSWDMTTLRNVALFLKCEISSSDFNLDFRDALRNGSSTLFIKGKRILEQKRGYLPDASGEKPYLGDANHLYLRYRYEYGQLFKAGITCEKDAGEPFFSNKNKYGFDFYSFFIYARNISKTFSAVSLGDFSVSMGQGLILHNDFGTGKSSFVMNVKKSGRILRPYSSVNETNFFRGAGAVIQVSRAIQAGLFASHKPIDATTIQDTAENTDFDAFGSIRFDGFHRTAAEIAHKNRIYQSNGGIQLTYNDRQLKLSVNGLYTSFSSTLSRSDELYQKYLFSGDRLMNTSVDYSYRFRNLHFFGETAVSHNGGAARIHGLLAGLDRKLDVSFVYRNYDADYQVINANAFATSNQPINEKGFYTGIEIRPLKNTTISAYADFWSNPWVGYRRDAPADGKTFFLKLAYTQKRKLDVYLQYRIEKKQVNNSEINIIDFPEFQTTQRLRLHLGYQMHTGWEIRNRVEFSFFKKENFSRGFLFYQDVLYKPIAKSFSFTARYTIFDVNSFDARIYAYENDILFEYYVPFFQQRGSRFYINTRYRFGSNYTFEFRLGQSYYQNAEGIGSGNEFSSASTRTEMKMQLKIKF